MLAARAVKRYGQRAREKEEEAEEGDCLDVDHGRLVARSWFVEFIVRRRCEPDSANVRLGE
jgi:hypothetical protein